MLGLKCESGHITVPPRHCCRVCESSKLEVVELSGSGRIASFTEVYSKSKDFPLDPPYTLALVELDEGGKLLGIAYNSHSPKFKIERGLPVRMRFLSIYENEQTSTKWPRVFADLEQD